MKSNVPARLLVLTIGAWVSISSALAYTVSDYEEDAGISFVGFRSTDGDIYGAGFESGVWLTGTPVFGELFGHWLSNAKQDGNYYSAGMTIRLMPRTSFAPFIGGGGSYNGLTSDRNRGSSVSRLRLPDSSYWQAHAEGGLRIYVGGQRGWFIETTYRAHWTDTGSDFNYEWISLELGQSF